MANTQYSVISGAQSVISANKVLKNTYMLLAATLGFSALTAVISMALALPTWMYLVSVIGAMVMGMFVLPRTANSSARAADASSEQTVWLGPPKWNARAIRLAAMLPSAPIVRFAVSGGEASSGERPA